MKVNPVLPIRLVRSRELRLLRRSSRLTQVQLSVLSGLTQKTISRLELGKVAWSIDSEIIFREAIRNFMDNKKSA